jgi:hypothetical protein
MILYILIIINCILYAKANIIITTMSIGEEYINKTYLGIINKQNYANKYNYTFINYNYSLDANRPIPWSKILIIQKHLKDAEWIFWTDADSLIMNDKIKIETLIDNNYNFILSRDFNNYNTGQFLIKNCDWSFDFLDRVYKKDIYINHSWWEQMAIIDILDNNSSDYNHTKIIPQNKINSYIDNYKSGDFIIHFPNKGNKLIQYMYIWYNKIYH